MNDTPSTPTNSPVDPEYEEFKLVLACVQQMARDVENMASQRRMTNARLTMLNDELSQISRCSPGIPVRLQSQAEDPNAAAIQALKQSLERRKAALKEMCDTGANFAQKLIQWGEALEKRRSRQVQPDTDNQAARNLAEHADLGAARGVSGNLIGSNSGESLATLLGVGAIGDATRVSQPHLNSPTTATGDVPPSEPPPPDVPNPASATLIAGGATAAIGSLAWALTTSILAGKRATNIVNYGNPYGPSYDQQHRVGHTYEPQAPSDAPQTQAQQFLLPPPDTPPKLAPPGFPGDNRHNHHWFPQQFSEWSSEPPRNIDIDEYTTEMPQQWHTGADISIHANGYNTAWRAFIEQYPNATYMQTVNFMNALKNSMGFGLGY